MNRKIIAAFAFALLVASGCAAGAGGGGGDRDVITQQQIEASGANGVDQLIEWEEPSWLRGSGKRVFVDGAEWGGMAVLQDIPLSSVREIRYWRSQEAVAEFGAGYSSGVLAITTR